MPKSENIPALNINIEGLKRHLFMTKFLPETSITSGNLKLRAWLLHTIATSARNYSKARELVTLQNKADQVRDGGAIFYALDVAEQIESCVMATHRACMAIKKMVGSLSHAGGFYDKFGNSINKLSEIRNQFEHMHTQIVSNESGSGPISIEFSDEGRCIRFRKLKLETIQLHGLIEGTYRLVASLYPGFNADSPAEAAGPIKLTVTADIIVKDSNGDS